jgi:hypothetical protein
MAKIAVNDNDNDKVKDTDNKRLFIKRDYD